MPRPRPLARLVPIVPLLLLVAAFGGVAEGAPEGVRLVEAWPGTAFESPIGLVGSPQRADAMYVLEQGGRILSVAAPAGGAAAAPAVFLDLSAKVMAEGQGGLLGLAFHPAHASNRRVFVAYLASTGAAPKFKIVLSEFRTEGGRAVPASERVLLEIPKSTAHHNGGGLLFGPDGMLYMSTGDNRIQKEAVNTAQSPASLLGKILRLDVDRPAPGLPYGIPADNPWAAAGPGVRREIWAYGFRNPWRFSFDPQGNLWTCDPGSKGECHECVIQVKRAGNHGWPFFEGTRPMEPIPEALRGTTFVPPFFEYVRTGGEGSTAAVGGYVYRGNAVPSLRGMYVFGDYGRGIVMALDVRQRPPALHVLGAVNTLSSIGEDANGELYASSHEEGKVYAIR